MTQKMDDVNIVNEKVFFVLVAIVVVRTAATSLDTVHVKRNVAPNQYFGLHPNIDLNRAGSSSLAFVFDTTGSMYDDLVQVREGAKRIFATVLAQREQLIQNYVLVPFHDPDVGPVFQTPITEKFQSKLDRLIVQGGGDCPEMCISAIKQALEVALPSSFVFVFTDARAKDYHVTNDVLNLIQEKQSQVVFVMTGDCGDRAHEGYTAFHKIASTSNGQVFHLEKQDVNQVITFVEESVQTRKLRIESINRPNPGPHIVSIPIDSRMNNFTIAVSGEAPEITLIDPAGRRSDNQQLSHVLRLPRALIVNVKDPTPGMWQLRLDSKSSHTVRVSGVGQISFQYGFSPKVVDSITLAYNRPLTGIMTHILVNATGLSPPGRASDVELVDFYGKTLFKQPLRTVPRSPDLYFAGPFISPLDFYFVKVTGFDDRNFPFQRISQTAIANQTAGAPRVFMPTKTTVYRHQDGSISCDVASRAPFTVYWSLNGRVVGGPLFYNQSERVVLPISVAKTGDIGEYHCRVASSLGNASASTIVEVKDPPPTVVSAKNVTVGLGQAATLQCRSQTSGPVQIRWEHAGTPLFKTQNVVLDPSGTLKIMNAQKSDGGIYRCVVSNNAGRAFADVTLYVVDPPRVFVYPKSLYFTDKSAFNLTCVVSGNPQPQVDWFFNSLKVLPDQKHFITYKYDLLVRNAGSEDGGLYECRAKNVAGTSSGTADVTLAVPPQLNINSGEALVGPGQHFAASCKVLAGTPTPTVKWYHKGKEVLYVKSTADGIDLAIEDAHDSDSGDYVCVADNEAGRATASVSLDVGAKPVVLSAATRLDGEIFEPLSIPCPTIGHPTPEIKWYKDGILVNYDRKTVLLPDNSLSIQRLEVIDKGVYKCEASNLFGTDSRQVKIDVVGLVPPVLSRIPSPHEIVEGQSLQKTCIAPVGNPPPKLTWLKDGVPLKLTSNIQVLRDGSDLSITNIAKEDEGVYSCVAENEAGKVQEDVTVEVLVKPVILDGPSEYDANEGDSLVIPCRSEGDPKPTTAWFKEGKPLHNYQSLMVQVGLNPIFSWS